MFTEEYGPWAIVLRTSERMGAADMIRASEKAAAR
jgi:hypothetical protein